MNYELHMGEALAEARAAVARGERARGAAIVLDEALVARAGERVRETGDPTAHAVLVAVREAARRIGAARLRDATVFATTEPCPMCVGALLAADVAALVFGAPDRRSGAAGGAVSLADGGPFDGRLRVVSGIRRHEVEELVGAPVPD
jgi:tRNA(adenine34) deaminase